MPAIGKRYQANGANGSSPSIATASQQFNDSEARAIASKKLQLIEEEMDQREQSNGFINTNGLNNAGGGAAQRDEVFQDTCAQPVAHSRQQQRNSDNSGEQILIYDGQNNTSIAQTAKDQFAAALLRLQNGLDESTKRLLVVESKVDDFIKQQQERNQLQSKRNDMSSNNKKGMGKFLNQGTTTLLYLGWPVLVFFALRAIERRTLTSSAAAAVIASN